MRIVYVSALAVLIALAALGLGWLYGQRAAMGRKLSPPAAAATSSDDAVRNAASQLHSASGADQGKAERAAEVLVQQRAAAKEENEHDVRDVIFDAIDRVESTPQRGIRETTPGLTETVVGCITDRAAKDNLDLGKMREARNVAHADTMDLVKTGPKSRAYVDAMWPVVEIADQCEKRLVGS